MAVQLQTYNEILGKLIRKIIADTPVNDINRGSVLLTLLEAVAAQDFENNANILSVLETISIDSLKNSDLDSRAADYGISRTTAVRSTGLVKIYDTAIIKRSTTLYAVKPPPIAGTTIIYVNDASAWNQVGGTLYIGRGTQQFEGPINYTSIVNSGSFYTITLASALQKDHLVSDSVVDGQGTVDRLIPTGTTVKIPANNQNPEITYTTLRDAVIAAGEDSANNIPIAASRAGSQSNAGINSIVSFQSIPFPTAAITNTNALTDGRDVESDNELRERIKNYAATLARGTRASILNSLIGVSDTTDGKQVSSAVITEPASIGDPSIIYMDDGSGFEPTYQGQGVDLILSSAVGDEEFLQLANFPLPRPQVVNQAEGPYQLTSGMKLNVLVDGVEESIEFLPSHFSNIAAATLSEVIVAINNQSTLFKSRLTETSSRLLIYPVAHDAEYIQVSAFKSGDDASAYCNSILRFPTNKYSYITLYKNNELLSEKEIAASLISNLFSSWAINFDGTLSIEVDGTPSQTASFTTLDFNSQPYASLSAEDWASVFNKKFAGIRAEATSAGRIQITSNRIGSSSSLNVVGGSYFSQIFGGATTQSTGKNSDFVLNRQTGNLQIKTDILAGDSISAGTVDAKGSAISEITNSGTYNLSSDSASRPAEMVVVTDDANVVPRTGVLGSVGNTITITSPSSGVMRVMANTNNMFAQAQIGDYIYISNRGDILGTGAWVGQGSCGLYKVRSKGEHTSAGVDSYIDVDNVSPVVGGPYSFVSEDDMQAFKAEVYPQILKGSELPVPAASTLQHVVDHISNNMVNVKGTIHKTNAIKTTSTTENDGAVAIPVSVGRLSAIFESKQGSQIGNQSHIATKKTDKDLFSFFRRTAPTGINVWLDRYSYTDTTDTLDSDVVPNPSGYSEVLQAAGTFTSSALSHDDIVNVVTGSNKSQFRTIKEFIGLDQIGTQEESPKTLFDYLSGNEIEIVRPLSISSDDSIVFIIDGDAVNKTINVNFWRTGRVSTSYAPSTTGFSAYDADNEAGIHFGTAQVWSKATSGAEFKDYAVWFRSRNWYRTGGAGSAGATMLLRSKEYGPNGDKHQFKMEYPSIPNQAASIKHDNTPSRTLTTYTFASDADRVTGIIGGSTFKVTSLGSYNWRYTFQESYVDLSTLLVGDIVSLSATSGVSAPNRGTYRINAFNALSKYIDVYNPSGVATSVGQPEISQVTTIADVVGTPAIYTLTTTDQGVTASTVGSQEYFTLYDDVGMVVFWYDIDNAGAPAPTVVGASRYVEIPTVNTGDSANTVASKTAVMVNSDLKFNATQLLNVVTITNAFNGPVTLGSSPNTGFSLINTVAGTSDATLGGKYFKLYDQNGSVAVWMNVNGELEPLHGCNRSIQVILNPGDSANTIASTVAATVNVDAEFSASAVGNIIAITDAVNGIRTDATAETSTFTVSTTQQGTNDGVESIYSTSSVHIFPLTDNDAQTVSDKISESQTLLAVPVGNVALLFDRATREDTYSYSGNSSALAYEHDPNPLNLKHDSVSLFDGESFIKTFSNSDPHFVLKRDLLLPGVVPAIYNMSSCPNSGSTDLGEFFKLVPKTIKNVKHHLSHKALSQLPIVADVDIAGNYRKIQVKSKKLGTSGAVEVVGGRANLGEFSIIGESQVTPSAGVDYLEAKISAYPATINNGDYVKIYNQQAAKRKSRLLTTDSFDVANPSGNNFEYRFNAKSINSSPFTSWTIADVSGSYSKTAGTIWRWTHNDAGSRVTITGDSNGAVVVAPNKYNSAGIVNTSALEVYEYTNGTASTPVVFYLSVNATPSQGDYFTFQSASAVSYAVWFSVNGNLTAPSAVPPFSTATNQIIVSILSTSTPDQVIDALYTALNTSLAFDGQFEISQTTGTNLTPVVPGDMLNAYGSGSFLSSWNMRNLSQLTGDAELSGYPIINVNASSRYVDIINPNGVAMSATIPGLTGNVAIHPSPALRFRLRHSAKTKITTAVVSSNVVTVTTLTSHGLGTGDTVVIDDCNTAIDGSHTIVSTPSITSFTFALVIGNATYANGNCMRQGQVETRYRVEKLGHNGMIKIRRVLGDSPLFSDSGVAIDDFVSISGTSFKTANNGRFRVVGVDNESIIVYNPSAVEERHTLIPFNDLDVPVSWTTNSTQITGASGSFKNLSVGEWVKKKEDGDEYFVQIVSLNASPNTATIINLGSQYRGISGSAIGVSFDQNSNVDLGVVLQSQDDIRIHEGDSVVGGDSLVIENISNINWFNTANSGVREIISYGTNTTDRRPFLRVTNTGGVVESGKSMAVKQDGLYILEGEGLLYETIRKVEHAAINQFNSNERVIYMTPPDRIYKVSQLYGSKIQSMGKLGFEVGATTGVDGYTYYVGLMRTAQRIVDGFEPDSINFPGRRAVGSSIEILPPLIKQVSVALDITTKDGVNLTDISNDIKSAIISYVDSLSVGGDVILSEMSARIMAISGIDAVTFTSPSPTMERITVNDQEKAYINPDLISLA